MIKEGLLEVRVEKLIPGGEGLARVDGMAVFVPGGLPGELVRAEIVQKKKTWFRTGKPQILEASVYRREPFCPLAGKCGGCTWQHLEYSAQLDAKTALVREAITRTGGLKAIPDIQVFSSRPDSYRSRIRPSITGRGAAGFLAAGSDQVVEVSSCPVATPGLNRFFSELPGELVKGSRPVVFGDDQQFWVAGLDREAVVSVSGRVFRFPPEVFFQSNLLILKNLIDYALNHPEITLTAVAMDLYGGVGLFGAFLADVFDTVIGVDSDPGAADRWKSHVGAKGIFYSSTLENWVKKMPGARPDFIVVDPPRTGLSGSVREALIRLGPPVISYVSCDPVTQARDLADFILSGYSLDSMGLFDLYPQTPHVETVARLIRNPVAVRWGAG